MARCLICSSLSSTPASGRTTGALPRPIRSDLAASATDSAMRMRQLLNAVSIREIFVFNKPSGKSACCKSVPVVIKRIMPLMQ